MVSYSAASCAIETQRSCSAVIVSCADNSAPTCWSTPQSTDLAQAPGVAPGCGATVNVCCADNSAPTCWSTPQSTDLAEASGLPEGCGATCASSAVSVAT